MNAFIYGLYRLVISFVMFSFITSFRNLFCRIICGKVGKYVYFSRNIDLRKPSNVFIGDNTIINKRVLLDGRGGMLKIGSNVDIAQDVYIWTLEHDINGDNHDPIGSDVIIEDYVWIGARATILPGVKIGRGAVVGTASLVTKDVPPMSVVGGIPASVLKMRNNKLKYKLDYNPYFV